REDLYHRFNEFSINIPPLRGRREDIPLFAEFFLQKACTELNKNIEGFDKEVVDLFLDYAWPGNLREFRNVIRRAALLTNGSFVSAATLPWEITNRSAVFGASDTQQTRFIITAPASVNNNNLDLKNAATQAEYETIMNVLKQVNFNKTKAAELLKIDRKTLYNKLRMHESQNEVEE
ncbi:MAG TPA: helix-turn-helix domain-containing protein, partial [Chitinophagaceae bacterium]|nr:helix-turn-helix domain-containing protein [Chitinophagaceae bacterium]